MKKFGVWFKELRNISKFGLISAVAVVSLIAMSASAQPNSNTSTETNGTAPAAATPQKQEPKVEVKTETSTEAIPFTSSTVDDASLASGTTQTRTAGSNGTLTHSYQVTYKDGVEISRSAPVDTITAQPVDEVVVHGTKVSTLSCPDGTYVNTAGNTVCRPYESSSTPSGATAQCSDGSYSYSQSRRGTCSHHGGVATWL